MSIHFLYPSTIYVSEQQCFIDTILGSCVAICLFDPENKIGGMNHYMLPFWNGQGLASPKYGNIAIEKLIDQMVSHGSRIQQLKAKVFGGGEVLQQSTNLFNIGQNNILVAQKILQERNIPIVAQHTGGQNGRKIRFNTTSGGVGMKIIPRTVDKVVVNP